MSLVNFFPIMILDAFPPSLPLSSCLLVLRKKQLRPAVLLKAVEGLAPSDMKAILSRDDKDQPSIPPPVTGEGCLGAVGIAFYIWPLRWFHGELMVIVVMSQEPGALCKLYLNYKQRVSVLSRPSGKDESLVQLQGT